MNTDQDVAKGELKCVLLEYLLFFCIFLYFRGCRLWFKKVKEIRNVTIRPTGGDEGVVEDVIDLQNPILSKQRQAREYVSKNE